MANGDSQSSELNINLAQAHFKEKFKLAPGYLLPRDTIKALGLISSDNPAVRPVIDESPSLPQIEKWKTQFIGLFPDKTTATRVANALLGNLVRIDEFHFEQKLLSTFNDSLNVLHKANVQDMAFVYYSGGKERSTPWVIDILKDHLPNEQILELPLLDHSNKSSSTQSEVGIIVDDAGYSATQIRDHIFWGKKNFGMKRFYVIVPFITEIAIDRINRVADAQEVKVDLFSGEKMMTLEKILGEDDFNWLNNDTPFHRLTKEQTTTYFAHKVPDYRSFCPYIGDTKDVQVEGLLDSLVPNRPAVYHKNYFADLRKRGKL